MREPGNIRVAFGLPAADAESHFREAIESLLAQSHPDFVIAVADDCSTDATLELARLYEALDDRVTVHPGTERLGLVGNWRRAQRCALAAAPGAEFFAWASDHDIWHEDWLATLMAELESHPEAVLAYPLTLRISERGADAGQRPRAVDTSGQTAPAERLRTVIHRVKAGDTIYGLMRVEPLLRCGPLPLVGNPDRFLLTRLALEGEFRQVPRLLWSRRYRQGVRASAARQRRSFYPNGAPLRAYLPWPIAHSVLFRRGDRGAEAGRDAAGYAGLHFRESMRFAIADWKTRRLRSARRCSRALKRHRARWRGRLVRVLRRVVPAPLRRPLRSLVRVARRTAGVRVRAR
jgi:glycosyltransferase involved in cell wall biosynthesis